MTDPTAISVFAYPAWKLLTALGIGALIGLERERHKGEGPSRGPAGLRTFALIGLLGGLSTQFGSPVVFAIAAAFTATVGLVAYWLSDRRDPGLTTEVAMLVTFLLGAEVQSQLVSALAIAVVVTVLLAWRTPLHHLARDILTEQELHDGLIFAIAALVILPLLPDHAIDPFGLLNPFALWRLAVVLMALSGAAYIAMRVLGPRAGLLIAGFASGFVSSTMAIASMGGRTRADASVTLPGAAGAVSAIVGSLSYLAALVAAIDPYLLQRLAIPLAAALLPTFAYALVLAWRGRDSGVLPPVRGRAFDIKTVAIFISLAALFALISSVLVRFLGDAGVFAAAVATGLVDAHAAAVSVATLTANVKIDPASGALAILIGLAANMAAKIPMAFAAGTRGYAMRVSFGLVILLAGLGAGYALA